MYRQCLISVGCFEEFFYVLAGWVFDVTIDCQRGNDRRIHLLVSLVYARSAATESFAEFDALLRPVPPNTRRCLRCAVDPISINRRMGTYINFCNLLDLAAVAIPGAPTVTGSSFGAMIVVPTFADQVAIDIASGLSGIEPPLFVEHGIDLSIFGAQPLHWQLEELGARYGGPICTSTDITEHRTVGSAIYSRAAHRCRWGMSCRCRRFLLDDPPAATCAKPHVPQVELADEDPDPMWNQPVR